MLQVNNAENSNQVTSEFSLCFQLSTLPDHRMNTSTNSHHQTEILPHFSEQDIMHEQPFPSLDFTLNTFPHRTVISPS